MNYLLRLLYSFVYDSIPRKMGWGTDCVNVNVGVTRLCCFIGCFCLFNFCKKKQIVVEFCGF